MLWYKEVVWLGVVQLRRWGLFGFRQFPEYG